MQEITKQVLEAIRESSKGITLFELVNKLNIPEKEASESLTTLYRSNLIKDIGVRKSPRTLVNELIWIDAKDNYAK